MTRKTNRRQFVKAASAAVLAASAGVRAAEEPASSQPPRPQVVDCHVHLKHGDVAGTEYSPEAIIEIMDRVKIDQSVVFAMSTTTRHSVEMAEAAVKKYPQRLIPFVYALPSYERPVVKELEEAISERKFRGIKLHAGECKLAEYIVDPVLALAGNLQVPCLIDCGGNLAAARRMAEGFPKTVLIFAHMGRYLSTDKGLVDQFIRMAEEFGNVVLDVSGVVLAEMISEAVRRIGSARLAWGTDGPHPKPDLAAFARNELDKIRQLELSPDDTRNLLGGTILRLLRL